jgi:hypothetical protein
MTLPSIPVGKENFFYASQTSYWIYFRVNKKELLNIIGKQLDDLGFTIATFDEPEFGYVALSPMFYTALFGEQTTEKNQPGMQIISEVEFTVLVYPKRNSDRVPNVTFKEFILGHEQQKLIGQYRLSVVCDSLDAVYGGRNKYGEHKFLGDINYKISTFNNNPGRPLPITFDVEAYQWGGAGNPEQMIFSLSAIIDNTNSIVSDVSPLVVYGAEPPEKHPIKKQRPIASRRNYLTSLFQIYFPNNENIKINIKYGSCKNAPPLQSIDGNFIDESVDWPQQMRETMVALLENSVVSAALIFQSPPAGTEPRPYYVD